MPRNLTDVLTVAVDVSNASGGKVAFSYLPVANMVTFHFYNTEAKFSVILSDDDAEAQLNGVMEAMIGLYETMGGEVCNG